MSRILFVIFIVALSLGTPLQAADANIIQE